MKKILLFILSLGLTVGIFGGCSGANSGNSDDSSSQSSAAANSSSSSIKEESSSVKEDSSSAEAQTFTIVFRQEGQEDIVKQVKEGETLKNVPTPTPKTGYTVTWSVTDFTNVTKNMTVDRVERANTYTITYDAGEGTASAKTQTVTYDKAPESFATATREGYNFICWKYDGKVVQPTELWKIDGNVTFVAEWSPIVKHTVSFVQDGEETIKVTVADGDSVENEDIPTPKGKVGYTVVWENVDLTNVKGDITVHAVATANTYIITYDAGEGTASAKTQTVTYDKAPESLATATREGYNFVCWKYDGKAIQPTELWKIAENVTLVAEWAPAFTYTVSFIQDGVPAITIATTDGGSLQAGDIPDPQPKTGYTVTWEEKDLTNIKSNITVHAIATPNTYTITYDAGEGTASAKTQTVTYDKAPESFATATREGYNFVCWKYDGKAVQPTELWKIDGNVTFVAEWSPIIKHTVSFVQAGEDTLSIMVEDGASLIEADIPAPQPKTGYTVAWEEKDLTNIKSDITVQAIITAKTYTVTFDAGEGTVTPATQTVTYDKAPESFATPTREGYKFVCWKYEDKIVSASELWTIDSDVTLQAVWAKIYTIVFDLDGGTMSTTTMTVIEGEAYTLPIPSKDECSFIGWYYGTTKVSTVDVWEISSKDATITLKARWRDREWTDAY